MWYWRAIHTLTHIYKLTSFYVQMRYCLGMPLPLPLIRSPPSPCWLLQPAKAANEIALWMQFKCCFSSYGKSKIRHQQMPWQRHSRVASKGCTARQVGRWWVEASSAALATCQATKSNNFFIDKTFACCSQGKQQGAPQPRPLSAMPQKVMYMERWGCRGESGKVFTLLPVLYLAVRANVCAARNFDSLDR